ncbi:MAG: branched-chain amino acid ABC transporter ATP-binding protein/permease [Nitratireductor sp.]|nr:branched-chain amino acid ABC transporter ATP-binding protein/permease [Nitratireductor sp.]
MFNNSSANRPLWLIPLAVGVLFLFLPLLGLDYGTSRQVQLSIILALVVSGMNLSLGYAGELALGQVAMYAAGAYAAGLLSIHGQTDLLIQLAAAGLSGLVVGVLTGVPGLRMGSWTLAMTSFFLVLLVPDIISVFKEYTGGRNGLAGINPPTVFGYDLGSTGYYVAMVLVTMAWFAAMRNIVASRMGLALRVLKKSPVLASAMGISVYRMKLMAYALAAIPAGLAGALFANLDLYVSPESIGFGFAVTVLAASVLGGSMSVYGAIAGAGVLQFALNYSSDLQQFSPLIAGVILIVGGVALTGGLAGMGETTVRWLGARLAGAGNDNARASAGASAGTLDHIDGQPLIANDVSKSFGGNQALDGVSLQAMPGAITALIGPNGSGKTTLLNIICGFYRGQSGEISLGGKEMHGLAPDRVARLGVSRTFQTPHIPDQLTVKEVVITGRYTHEQASILGVLFRSPRYRRIVRNDERDAKRVLELVGLAHLESVVATSLPLGQRRLLELARCLISNPGAILLDEVASGLDENEIKVLSRILRELRDKGSTIVLVEHNFQLVTSLADQIFVLAQGRVMSSGTPEHVRADPKVKREYLGVDTGNGDQE